MVPEEVMTKFMPNSKELGLLAPTPKFLVRPPWYADVQLGISRMDEPSLSPKWNCSVQCIPASPQVMGIYRRGIESSTIHPFVVLSDAKEQIIK